MTPTYIEQTASANPFSGIVVGAYSAPTFADIDGDGDLDAVVGASSGTLNYFENIGSSSSPSYSTTSPNPFSGIVVGAYSAPTFADIDGDGDLDAVVGASSGTLNYFENIGSSSSPSYSTTSPNPFSGIDVGSFSAPTFADIDGDGDLDAVVGEGDGTLNYFENIGSSSSPSYSTTSPNPFSGIDVGFSSAPTFADIDGDGDLDAVVGKFDGTLNYFENIGSSSSSPSYSTTSPNPFSGIDVGSSSIPTFADIDGDGDLDAVVGEGDGTLNYFENTTPTTPATPVVADFTAGVLTLTVNDPTQPLTASGTATQVDPNTVSIPIADITEPILIDLGDGSNSIDTTGLSVKVIYTSGSGADSFTSDSDLSTVSYSTSSAGVTIDLAAGTATGGTATGDTLTGIDNIEGSNQADTLTGNSNKNKLFGLDGADVIAGGDGNDLIEGGAGSDNLDGGGDRDVLSYANSAAGVTINLSNNTASGGDAQGDTIANFENVVGSNQNDTLTGDSQSNYLFGLAGDDILNGEDGRDVLVGGDGNDTLSGGADNDTLRAGDGNDTQRRYW